MSFNGSTLARQLDRLEQDRRLQGISRRTARLVPKNRKAGRLGNDRPSLGARLGVGYRSLGVCGKGASMKRPGEPPADYLNFFAWQRRWERRQILKQKPFCSESGQRDRLE